MHAHSLTTRALTRPRPSPAGIVNFIDARTQWIDDGLKRALDDGIKQVGHLYIEACLSYMVQSNHKQIMHVLGCGTLASSS